MRKTRKGSVKPFIYEAFQVERTPSEAVQFIRETHTKEVALRTIYHHIDRIRKGHDDTMTCQVTLTETGRKYIFVRRTEEEQTNAQYLRWFIETYDRALKEQDEAKVYLLHKELLLLCEKESAGQEAFVDFLLKLARETSCRYQAGHEITLDVWECLARLYHKLRYADKEIVEKLVPLDGLFSKVFLDSTRPYGVERFIAFHCLVLMQSQKADEAVFTLLMMIDPKRTIPFSPFSESIMKEATFFEPMIRSQIRSYAHRYPSACKRRLFDLLDIRKQRFGKADPVRTTIVSLIEDVQSSL